MRLKLCVWLATAALALGMASAAMAAVPGVIPFQGRLTDATASATPISGSRSIVFSLFAAPTGGSAVWTETQPTVTIANGLFSVDLGSVTAFPAGLFSGADLYLEIKVGADAAMTPRQRLGSVAFAQTANVAGTVAVAGNVTLMYYTGQDTGTPTFTPTAQRAVGNFTKLVAGTDIEVDWTAHGETNGVFCQWVVRIDGASASAQNFQGPVLYGPGGSGLSDSPLAWHGVFRGLAAGSHAVSIWLYGSATSCILNRGNFPQLVAIREIGQTAGAASIPPTAAKAVEVNGQNGANRP